MLTQNMTSNDITFSFCFCFVYLAVFVVAIVASIFQNDGNMN